MGADRSSLPQFDQMLCSLESDHILRLCMRACMRCRCAQPIVLPL